MTNTKYDYAIVGAGVGGLFTGALLAKAGKRVYVAEKHYALGGYGHSFLEKKYDFCAQLHYLWNCLPGEPGHQIFKKLGLEDKVRFVRLDPDGFDHIHFPSQRYQVVKGFERNIGRLAALFPSEEAAIRKYFKVIHEINEAILALPIDYDWKHLALNPVANRILIRYYGYTLQKLFDDLNIPLALQNLLAGQSGNLLAPPATVSLFIHAGMVVGYDRGACVPEKGFRHLFKQVAEIIRTNGGEILTRANVTGLILEKGRASGIRINRCGVLREVRAEHVIVNTDPKILAKWLPPHLLSKEFRRKLDYSYSPSNFTIYLGLKDINLANHGFGNWNIWHYAKDSVNLVYSDQLERDNLETPSLFISTPTLHVQNTPEGTKAHAPEGRHQMVICTMCNYDHFKKLKKDPALYEAEKDRLKDRIFDIIERDFVPGFRKYIDVCLTGSPTTNEHFVNTPFGNSYGADLIPSNYRLGRLNSRTPLPNLHLVGASAGVPSFAGGIHFAHLLAEKLLKPRLATRKAHLSRWPTQTMLKRSESNSSADLNKST